MKTVKFIFATLGLVFVLNACAPEHEDVTPDASQENLEKFEVKGNEGGSSGQTPTGR